MLYRRTTAATVTADTPTFIMSCRAVHELHILYNILYIIHILYIIYKDDGLKLFAYRSRSVSNRKKDGPKHFAYRHLGCVILSKLILFKDEHDGKGDVLKLFAYRHLGALPSNYPGNRFRTKLGFHHILSGGA